jgi:hypothetical protein
VYVHVRVSECVCVCERERVRERERENGRLFRCTILVKELIGKKWTLMKTAALSPFHFACLIPKRDFARDVFSSFKSFGNKTFC